MKFGFLVLSSLLVSSIVYGQTNSKQNSKQKNNDRPASDAEKAKWCEEYCCPKFNSCLDRSGKWEIYGDYLYWEAREDQLTYAQDAKGLAEIVEAGPSTTLIEIDVSTQETKFEWKSGFRVGTGYHIKRGKWDLQAFWTRLHERTKAHVSDSNAGIFPPGTSPFFFTAISGNPFSSASLSSSTFGDLATSAHNKWRLHFDTFDFQIGKSFLPNKCVLFRPFVGAKGAIINQKIFTNYDGVVVIDEDTGATSPFIFDFKKRNDFHGGGPSIGVDMAWEFFPKLSIVSDFTFATLFGKFHNKVENDITTFGDTILTAVNTNMHRMRPMVDAKLGLEWDLCCSAKCVNFVVNIGAAYEVQYWWNQLQVSNPSFISTVLLGNDTNAISPQGDLVLHGLTVHGGLAF